MSKATKRKPPKQPKRKPRRPPALKVSPEGLIKRALSPVKILTAGEIAQRGGEAAIDAELAELETKLEQTYKETGHIHLGTAYAALRLVGHRLNAPFAVHALLAVVEDLLWPAVYGSAAEERYQLVRSFRDQGKTLEGENGAYQLASQFALKHGLWFASGPDAMEKDYKKGNHRRRRKGDQQRSPG